MNSVHVEGDNLVEDSSYQEHEDEHEPSSGAETVEEGTPLEESSDFLQSDKDTEQEPLPVVEEPVGGLPKLSYASIVCTCSMPSHTQELHMLLSISSSVSVLFITCIVIRSVTLLLLQEEET